jgi:hypothetical protein
MKLLQVALILLLSNGPTFAGHGTLNGREAEGWDTGEYIVLLGIIQDVQEDRTTGEDRHVATFVPRATLGGVFDPSAHPILPVQFSVGRPTSSIAQAPEQGAVVMAVMRLVPRKKRTRAIVPSSTRTLARSCPARRLW